LAEKPVVPGKALLLFIGEAKMDNIGASQNQSVKLVHAINPFQPSPKI